MLKLDGLVSQPAAPSIRTERSEVRAFLGVFESVFQAMRQSTSRMAELAEEKARQQTEEENRCRAEMNAEEDDRRTERRRPSDTADESSPNRLDRLRQQADESTRTSEQTAEKDQIEYKEVCLEQASSSAQGEQLCDANPQSGESVAAAGLPTALSVGFASASFSAGPNMIHNPAGGAGPNGTSGGADQLMAQMAGTENTHLASTIPDGMTQSAGQNVVIDSAMQQIITAPDMSRGGLENQLGRSSNSPPIAAGKGGNGSAQSTGTTVDFQGILEGAARTRTDLIQNSVKTVWAKKQTSATSATIDLNRPGSIRELAQIVRGHVGARNSSMTLRLDPPELGTVRVDVRMEDQSLTLRFQADTQVGHEALHSKLGDLRDTLERQGIQVKEMNVELHSPVPAPAPSRDADNHSPQEGFYRGSSFDHSSGQQQENQSGPRSALSDGPGYYENSGLSENDEYDWVAGLAETGVDLVV